MNKMLNYLAAATLATPVAAFADQDFSAANRDVSVMAQILSGAFKSDNRHRSHASISGTYLAGQGALFTIKSYGGLAYSLRLGGDDSDNNSVFFFQSGDGDDDDSLAPLPPDAPTINTDDIADLAMSMANGGSYTMSSNGHMSSEIRSAIRDVARQLRDIDQQISDNRIELIHSDPDKQRKDIEAKIAELEKKHDLVDAKREKLEKQMEEAQKKFMAKRKEMMEKAKKARAEQLAKTEQVVMTSLCAYGSTLKNVPDNEHVSVIIEGRTGSGGSHHVYVMNKKAVAQCKSGGADGLSNSAVKYDY